MSTRILEDKAFIRLMQLHIADLLDLLLQRGQFFSIYTNITQVTFEPPLPDAITQHFKIITPFSLYEYSFESASFDEENLYFEAGFGSENIGAMVTVPLMAIVQILIDETPIFINIAKEENEKIKEQNIDKSMNIFRSNPKNKNLIKD